MVLTRGSFDAKSFHLHISKKNITLNTYRIETYILPESRSGGQRGKKKEEGRREGEIKRKRGGRRRRGESKGVGKGGRQEGREREGGE